MITCIASSDGCAYHAIPQPNSFPAGKDCLCEALINNNCIAEGWQELALSQETAVAIWSGVCEASVSETLKAQAPSPVLHLICRSIQSDSAAKDRILCMTQQGFSCQNEPYLRLTWRNNTAMCHSSSPCTSNHTQRPARLDCSLPAA